MSVAIVSQDPDHSNRPFTFCYVMGHVYQHIVLSKITTKGSDTSLPCRILEHTYKNQTKTYPEFSKPRRKYTKSNLN